MLRILQVIGKCGKTSNRESSFMCDWPSSGYLNLAICLECFNLDWRMKDLARELFISQSEISESLNRSYHAQLIDYYKRRVFRLALHEFTVHAIQYVFPQ